MSRSGTSISPEGLALLQKEIYRDSGIVLDDSKQYLIESRLASVLEQHRLTHLDDLCAMLCMTGGISLRQEIVEAMTTNETLFFRDEQAFTALQRHVLPELVHARREVRKLNIWSAASSTGQEAYSVAMMLNEMNLAGWTYRILATDINSQVIDRARKGRYRKIEVSRGLPAEYLDKYFDQHEMEWQISDRIRSMVEFAQFDLRRSMKSFGSFDLVLCRNVLIYFDVETKKNILKEIRDCLSEQGFLLLGCAESILNLDIEFEKRLFDQATFYQVL